MGLEEHIVEGGRKKTRGVWTKGGGQVCQPLRRRKGIYEDWRMDYGIWSRGHSLVPLKRTMVMRWWKGKLNWSELRREWGQGS